MSFQENAFFKSSKITYPGLGEEYFLDYPTLFTHYEHKLVNWSDFNLKPRNALVFRNGYFFLDM